MTVNLTDGAVRAELWTSFRSLLQAYLAAGLTGGEVPQALVAESDGLALQIIGTIHTVRLELQPETGEGYWVVFAGPNLLDEGAFRLHLDAEFEWSGKPGRLAMDAVAEALVTLVTP